ncbi:hypothetical protein JQ633_09345 [Bradyrhizobium tropiciagri]|uniref:hypothetical protein n=1 Tax=Bradyrhizobium tropiciagri TaxID=312253 RepID=UPI001BA5C471|nr:hypothetical protein [Bradyrhizobium tropiciagri]MBR0870562.1 hypothetical protein [Bradyrhizobium tropiciagri]
MQSLDIEAPRSRRLRIFAFDPSLAQRTDTAAIQEIVVAIPWERSADGGRLPEGPVGEYIEVVDVDPASGAVYPPVNLDDPNLLAQDGLSPSEGNPQFHQQMVYAVAMTTIGHFERALGRVALWAPRRQAPDKTSKEWRSEFVRRLRIYPHALRDQNAYYSPSKRALLFGYFSVLSKDADNTPGTTVFACLSHDIIAHETTHALLDGVHPRFNEPSNPDVHAFHEGFADIVAMFQHFSYAGVLRDQIGRTRGQLNDSESLLGQLAQQFGRATGRGNALRDALGETGKDGKWRRRMPDPRALDKIGEPHARGAILVAAVFGAFLLVYKRRTSDLFRLATQGTGILPEGEISPDLANRLAEEASRCARDLLHMCIRALDYCPPVGITFGDYLRAIVTGDVNLNADDDLGYRVALIESFRAWGIYPRGIRSMSIEGLVWPSGAEVIAEAEIAAKGGKRMKRTGATPSKEAIKSARDSSASDIADLFTDVQKAGRYGGSDASAFKGSSRFHKWDLSSDRYQVWRNMEESRAAVWRWLVLGKGKKYLDAFGLVIDEDAPKTVYRNAFGEPTIEVHSVRTALRRDSRGQTVTDIVVEATQRRRGYFEAQQQKDKDESKKPIGQREDGDFKFRAGCTIIIDGTKNTFRHIIRTPGRIDDDGELEIVRAYLTGEAEDDQNAFDGRRQRSLSEPRAACDEPFAILHRHHED